MGGIGNVHQCHTSYTFHTDAYFHIFEFFVWSYHGLQTNNILSLTGRVQSNKQLEQAVNSGKMSWFA